MNLLVSVFLAAAAGSCLALQASANGRLRQNLGGAPWYPTFFSICGTIATVCVVMLLLRPPVPPADAVRQTQWWNWIGGPLGVVFVLAGAALGSDMGPALFFASVVAGQLVCSLALDHFGLMGLPPKAIDPGRAIGVVLVVAGVVCIKWL